MPRYTVLDRLDHDGKAYGPDEKLKTVEMAAEDAEHLVADGVLTEAPAGKAAGEKGGKQ